MRLALRIVWIVNIALCLALAIVGNDRSDNLLQAAMWSYIWLLSETVWQFERERAS